MEKILICILSLFGIILLIGFSKANCNFGKWGGSCQYNCSTTCYYGNECTSNDGNCGCEQLHGNCYGCAKNYFGDVCNKACNQNCSLSDQCVLSGLACGCARQLGYCTSCPKTLWGNYCDRSCSIRCINFECDRTSGQCTSGCTKGYYGSDCSSTCPITCQFGCDQQTSTCFPSYCVNCNGGLPKCDQSNRKCLNGCIDGFYGPSCDKTCSVVTNDTFCTKCQALISIGITVCTECQPEYYYEGINGNCKTCSTGCKSNNTNIAKCFPDTGNCRFGCSAGWSGPRCDSFTCSLANCESCVANQPTVCERCQTGWYLDSGKCVKCSDNCATLNSCDTISGTCTGGCKTGWYGNTCKDNCTANCNKGECDNNGICSSGCNSKRYGQKCDLQCPNCLTTCNRNTGLCDAGCVDGYHGNDCLQPCNSNCLNNKCSQVDSKCFSGCKQGFYGEFCQLPCGSNCDGNSCNPTTGACSGNCLSGKYGDYCDLDCSANCSPRTCIKVGGACTSDCVAGYYGSHCSRTCPSSCSTNQCNKADGTCSGNCPNMKFGTRCELSCSSNCKGTSCDRSSGRCIGGCKAGYYGDSCEKICTGCDNSGCDQTTAVCIGKCIDGFYGNNCNTTCSMGCLSSSCDKQTGKCSICKQGYYGNTCSNTCSNNCKFSRCNQTTGLCSEGCAPGKFGQLCDNSCSACTLCNQTTGTCEGCAPGKYGLNCQSNCNTNCGLSPSGQIICDGIDGYCLNSCKDGWYGTYCDIPCNNNIHCITTSCERLTGRCSGNCVTGWYGATCNLRCSGNCFGNLCDRDSGECTYNCTSGFYGTQCKTPCVNTCTDCERLFGTCSTCQPGYYGQTCQSPCSSHCSMSSTVGNVVCNKLTGICNGGCANGWYGQSCTNECSQTCFNNECDIDSGKCSQQCVVDKYGEYCENSCTNCAGTSRGNCNHGNGNCLFGCDDGYFGNSCTQSCYPGCKNKKCIYSANNCSYGCENGLYGFSCTESCNTNCLNNMCDQKTGFCTSGCKPGWFGQKCKYACPVSCSGSVCDQVTGSCVGVCAGSDCQGTTIEDDTEVDIAIVIGATIGGAVVLLIIMIIVCCHCLRNKDRHDRKNGSDDVLTPHSDESLEGIDNHQFGYDEIKKDDWVMRNTIRYDTSKQNGTLKPRGGEADAHTDYYDFPPPPPEQTVADINSISFTTEGLPPPPLTVHFSDFDGREGIQVEMLPQYVEYMLHKDNAFESEYDGLPHGLKHQYDVALRPGNKRKNRYKNIYAYDHSRVVLQPEVIDSEDGSSYTTVDNSDYINASYFDGYQDPRAYIACQGPTDEMVDDFWRMVWQLRIQNIVMLTNLIELGQIKCKKYWPDENKTERFGNIYVKFDYQETFADFILTNLIVTKIDPENTNAIDDQTTTEDNARLQVKHLQFTSWPDRDVPKYVTTLVEFHSKVNSLRHEGPLLVHCSAGVGRTGTFIGIDYLMDQADSEGRVNIYKCVEKMRIARPNMVQTPDQYVFLHQALAEALLTSESPVDEDEFENYYNQMQIKDPRSGLTRLQNEFEEVKTQRVKRSHEAAKAEENKHRNRHTNILASDECRVFLWSKIKGCTDYINAIYLPSFRNKYCFIATEMPQCSTIVDFCRMIFQEEVRTIVMLDNDTSGITVNEHYWPEANQTMEMGPFSINVTEVKEHNDYTLRSLNFKFAVDDQKGTYKVNQFHYKRWSEGKVTPVSVESFVDFINAVTEWQSDSVKHPIIVHCMNGATKVGLFCLVRACMDRLQSDGDVSVVHALHHMRARRSKLVPNYEQYKFCHDCLLRHLNSDHL
ncbi:uncharacterized protein [Mytilus edulis]|uniref:uncharacterized protein isoform X3 n=1 Tax=Mytilus edulis TaxID=6550 RepID=UPI0039EFD373